MNNQTAEEMEEKFDPIPAGAKICPFMSGFHKNILCVPDCALYRADKKDRECVLHELQSISWFIKQSQDKKPID